MLLAVNVDPKHPMAVHRGILEISVGIRLQMIQANKCHDGAPCGFVDIKED